MSKEKSLGLILLSSMMLTGCLGEVWTGANLVYDRHNVYKKVDDFQLGARGSRALYKDRVFKCPGCSIDLAVVNGDILLAGHVPTGALRKEAQARVMLQKGYRRLFNELAVGAFPDNAIEDNWITAKIRSNMVADADIDPHQFKVVTADRIVYLMGDVNPEQAKKVILIARKCAGVIRVVKLFKYYHLSDKE